MLIVISIVGILSAIMLPNFIGVQKRAYDAAASGCANDIAKKQAIFLIDNARFGTFTELNAQSDFRPNCPVDDVDVVEVTVPSQTNFEFTVKHKSGIKTYTIQRTGITGS